MRRTFLNITILGLFLFTQFISMYGGVQSIACPGDLDNLDDISLEDIVALDPFLLVNGGELPDTLPLGEGTTVLAFLHHWMFELYEPVRPELPEYELSRPLALMRDKGLWLINQAMLC